MPYIINKTNGTQIAIVQDGTINASSLDITLVGKNYTGYGETFNENFVKLLENFANTTPPPKRVSGQLWYDTGVRKIKIYDGSQFKAIGVVEAQDTKPSGYNRGDLWYNTAEGRLYAYTGNGSNWNLIGPLTSRSSTNGAISTEIKDATDSAFPVVSMVVDGQNVFVSSDYDFDGGGGVLPTDDFYANFNTVRAGITLPGGDQYGITYNPAGQSGSILWGTAANALGLVRNTGQFITADQYLIGSDLASGLTNQVVVTSDDGTLIGTQGILKLHVVDNTGNVTVLGQGNFLKFNVGSENYNVLTISTGTNNDPRIVPNSTSSTFLGTQAIPFPYIFGSTITGASVVGTSIAGTTVTDAGNRVVTSFTVNAGTGLSGGGTVNGPTGTLSFANTGVLSLTGTANRISVSAGTGNITLNLPQDLHASAVVTFATVNSTNVAATNITENGSRVLTRTTGVWTLAGTANQINASASQGEVTLSLPQNIHTGASPTFNGMTLSTLSADGDGSQIFGSWTLAGGATLQATYADLAERYHADREYDPGTVLVIGGDKEVTTTSIRANTSIAGIVSTNPAYTLNEQAGDDSTHPYIALKGRVPCRVIGPILKGDLLVTSSVPGYAERLRDGDNPNSVLGRALQEFGGERGIVEVMVV
jgi:hypothetical protein